MKLLEWWETHTRAVRNVILLALIDTVLFVGALLTLPVFTTIWHEILVGPLPDFYDIIARQLIALVRDMSPSAVAVSGSTMLYVTGFLTLLTVHLLVGYGIGYLFDHLEKSRWWSVTCYAVSVLILAVLHLFVAYRTTWLL